MQNFLFPYSSKVSVPARVFGTLNYFYGKEDSFYSGSFAFNTALEGGVSICFTNPYQQLRSQDIL